VGKIKKIVFLNNFHLENGWIWIFLFRPKTNIRQENASEYSANNEYLAQGSKHYKKGKFAYGKKFVGWQLQVPADLWATKTYCACMHKTLRMSAKKQLSRKNGLEMESY
jgi:hypothetical protein